MVFEGILLDQVTVGWRPAADEPFPIPDTNELVVFEAYFVRGFGIPAHPFLRKLLGYYGISLCHLLPNNILHISALQPISAQQHSNQSVRSIHWNRSALQPISLFLLPQTLPWIWVPKSYRRSLSTAEGWHGEGIHTSASQHVVEGMKC